MEQEGRQRSQGRKQSSKSQSRLLYSTHLLTHSLTHSPYWLTLPDVSMSSPLQRSVSFDEDYSYESIGNNYSRYSVGSTTHNSTPRHSLTHSSTTTGASGNSNGSGVGSGSNSYQNYNRDVLESRYHSDQGVDRSRYYLDTHSLSHSLTERQQLLQQQHQQQHNNSKLSRTGRQRKKAARVKFSDFQVVVKRRLYFCCVSSEIDLTELEFNLSSQYTTRVYGDALCISNFSDDSSDISESKGPHHFDAATQSVVFIFEFGTAVFWGLSEVDEMNLLAEIRKFVKIGEVEGKEFESGEDDMAFIAASDDTTSITITNDLLKIPEECHMKELLAVSYAISQSTVLAIFEERIDQKVEEYKFIPETLSVKGKISMPLDRIGMMIGDIFVIRHGLNLHSDILDTPDFFWDEDKYKPNYSKMMSYLEMDGRITVLNKRLDMLKELLDMLQHQIHNAHATKLEWIVIWLIIIEVAIEVIGGGGALLGLWTW